MLKLDELKLEQIVAVEYVEELQQCFLYNSQILEFIKCEKLHMNGETALKITTDIIENLRDTKKYKNLKQSRYLGILIDQVIKSRLTSDYTTPNIINPLNNCISKLLLAFFDSNHEKLS